MRGHRLALGIAVASDRIVVRSLNGAQSALAWERALHGSGAEWAGELRDALTELREQAPDVRALHVALMPSLAAIRIAELPSAPTSELRAAVERDAAKYFPVGGDPQVVQLEPATADRSGFAPFVVTVASQHAVDAIFAAASAANWTIATLATARFAWIDADTAKRGAGETARIVVVHDGGEEVLHTSRGAIARVDRHRRTIPAADENHDVLARSTAEAMELAARFAAQPVSRSLWPGRIYAERTRRTRMRARLYAAAAVLLTLAAAGIEWIAAARSVARVAEERAALRPLVLAAMRARDSLQSLDRRLTLLRSFGSDATQWSAVVSAVTKALPGDASLISFGASRDTLIIVGEAEQAASVFASFGQSPVMTRVRAESPIQQQVENGEVIAERFTIAAQLAKAAKR